MTEQHPITLPPELAEEWCLLPLSTSKLLVIAAQWGADQELGACCEYLVRCAQWEPEDVAELRTARRPQPPSLKERALQEVDALEAMGACDPDVIRLALEQLDD